MKSSVFWVVSQAENREKQLTLLPASAGFLLGLFFDPDDGGYMFLRKIAISPNYNPEDHNLRSNHTFKQFTPKTLNYSNACLKCKYQSSPFIRHGFHSLFLVELNQIKSLLLLLYGAFE
jgi:hypothetical protein